MRPSAKPLSSAASLPLAASSQRSTADCSDIGLTAQFYRPPRLTVEIASRRGCPSASTCIQCATRFNLVATCCKHPRAYCLVVQGSRGCASACSRGCVSASCCGGGGTGTSASGVDTAAVSWTGLPQFGQNLSSSLSSALQFVQDLCAIEMLPLPMPRSVFILAPALLSR